MKFLTNIKKRFHFLKTLKHQKRKNFILLASSIALIVIAGVLMVANVAALDVFSYFSPSNPAQKGIILFEGDSCDQCAKVEDYIKNNKVEEKVIFTRLEVFNNSDNANTLLDKARICGLDASQVGVPFVWDAGKCTLGYVDVINFFKTQMSQKPQKP